VPAWWGARQPPLTAIAAAHVVRRIEATADRRTGVLVITIVLAVLMLVLLALRIRRLGRSGAPAEAEADADPSAPPAAWTAGAGGASALDMVPPAGAGGASAFDMVPLGPSPEGPLVPSPAGQAHRHDRRLSRPRPARPLAAFAGVLTAALAVVVVLAVLPVGTVRSAAAPAPVRLSLKGEFNNIGVTSNSDPAAGSLDGSGAAFSAQALAAGGVRPGATITSHHVPFTWPDVAPGRPDNVTASGQALQVGGSGKMLSFLVTAGWGPASGIGAVVYSDGFIQRFTIGAPDWSLSCPSPKGPGVAVFSPYRNDGDGRGSYTSCVFYASVPLQAGKQLSRIILPDVSAPVPASGDASLHIFAVTIE
jgi:hypothetical protein